MTGPPSKAERRPVGGGAADFENNGTPINSPGSRVRQHRCATCGTAGRLSLADPSPDDQRPVLRLSSASPPRLLCALCRDARL